MSARRPGAYQVYMAMQSEKRADLLSAWQALQPHLPQMFDAAKDVVGTVKGLKDTGAVTYAKALGGAGVQSARQHGLGSTAAGMAGRVVYDATPNVARPAVGGALTGAGKLVKKYRGSDSGTGNALTSLGSLIKDTPKPPPIGKALHP